MIHAYRGIVPKVHPSAWIAESADVIGDVELGEESSAWFTRRRVTDKDLELIHRSVKIYMSLAADYPAAQAR